MIIRIEALLRLSVIRGVSNLTSQQPDHLAFLSMFCYLFTHARLQGLTGTVGFLFDMAMMWADDLTEEQRASMLLRVEALRSTDARVAYLFGAPVSHDGWLKVVLSSSPPAAAAVAGAGTRSPSTVPPSLSSPSLRPVSGTPHAATARPMQRVGAGAAGGPQSPSTPSFGVRGGGGPQQQQQQQSSSKSFGPAVPFPLKHWELLQDQGVSSAANDTAISLALVGTRRA
jgi:hypothetical protein